MLFFTAALALFSTVVLGNEITDGAVSHHRMLNAVLKPLPMATFFVPLQEQSNYDDVFKKLDNDGLKSTMVVMMSVTISTNKTVIWYDHWEDGFDVDATGASASKTTQVWGDGNSTNGCAPNIPTASCTNAADVLIAGTAIVMQNDVLLPRSTSAIVFDGGDRLQASFPVAMSRASFPKSPGSVMAGSVAVMEMATWGREYEAPVGAGLILKLDMNPFEISGFSCLAGEDNTKLTLPDGTIATLKMGESRFVPVKKSDKVTADKPIQVILLTLDAGSHYQTRWFNMRSVNQLQNSYVSPVGDSFAHTDIVVYNPGTTPLKLTYTNLNKTVTIDVASKEAKFTGEVPTGSGALLEADGPFHALSITDSEKFTPSKDKDTKGDRYDWGFALVPTNELTSQALVGLGYACTNMRCGSKNDRPDKSPIWLTAVEDADVYVDFKNNGLNLTKIAVNKLQSILITDKSDKDMSGAMIFAVKRGESKDTGRPVSIATAWGQNPAVSDADQDISLDMGTVVPPFPLVKAAKTADKTSVKPGEELTYTIRVSNVGHQDFAADELSVIDSLDADVTYVVGSTKISSSSGSTTLVAVADDAYGTKFPLDEAGFKIPIALPRYGGTVEIVFKVKVVPSDKLITGKCTIHNNGSLLQPNAGRMNFGTSTKVIDSLKCGGAPTPNPPTRPPSKAPTKAPTTSVPTKSPTKSPTKKPTKAPTKGPSKAPTNRPTATPTKGPTKAPTKRPSARPTKTPTKKPTKAPSKRPTAAPTKAPIKAPTKSPTKAPIKALVSKINVENRVVLGADSSKCDAAVEYVESFAGANVVYCFEVSNSGENHLNVTLTNPALNFSSTSVGTLKPGETVLVAYPSKITGALKNDVVVTGNPVSPDGKDIPNTPDVTDTDPSSVGIINYKAAVTVDNKVYLGDDNGESCGTTKAIELATANVSGADAVYCFVVTNTGNTWLSDVRLTNVELNYNDTSIGMLAPNASKLIAFRSTIQANLTNNVVVTGNPTLADGTDIVSLKDVSATDPSQVELFIPGNFNTGPAPNSTCIEDKWNSNHTKELMCTTKHVYLESIKSTTPVTCKAGEMVTITVDSSILIEGERNDLGWYVAVDGGDALTGTCAVNGLHQSNSYSYVITNANGLDKKAILPVWARNKGGDGDQCGDIKMDYDKGRLNTPVMVNVQLPCLDNNEDGKLDTSICFTWRGAANNKDECSIGNNVPGTDCTCYCSRYDINNTVVEPPGEHPCA